MLGVWEEQLQGLKVLTLREGDIAVGMEVVDPGSNLLIVSENGFGKKTPFKDYSVQGRGGKGIITYKVTEKTGKLVGAKAVIDDDQIMLINNNNIIIRLEVKQISKSGRNTMGVTLMKTGEEIAIVSIAKINSNDIEIEEEII